MLVTLGDCREVMAGMEADSVDAIVTDPPYGLEFMGKEWDRLLVKDRDAGYPSCRHAHGPNEYKSGMIAQEWHYAWAAEALRVLKPGGHMLAFGGTRTFHRLTCAIEEAGFEIRDCLMWLYGSGFPKSHDVSKAIDKAAGFARHTYSDHRNGPNTKASSKGDKYSGGYKNSEGVAAPATDAARRWEGWGTALKPAWEPIILAHKPFKGTVAANIQEHGTDAINVDGCRIETGDNPNGGAHSKAGIPRNDGWGMQTAGAGEYKQPLGRWPANLLLDEAAGVMLDAQSGEKTGGGASRFFYAAKASRAERNGATHPTVKPLDLMRWLVRLVTPPGGTVLDPFAGSGTTLIAAIMEGMVPIGIELSEEYIAQAEKRLSEVQAGGLL